MTNGFIEIADTESLDRFLAQSNGAPAIIFKHSNSCGISSRAYTQMASLGRPVGIVIVQNARPVSDEIEKRTGVGHETPQLFIFRNGKVVWTASHGQIKSEAVESALAEMSKQ
ncbi:MAG: bacillithiol system redox-active protein YtxJ [Acidobacteriota bacterium]